MTVTSARVFVLLVLWSCASFGSVAAFSQARVFEFSYHVLAPQLPTGEPVDIYIPLPADHPGQRVLEENLSANLPGEIGIEERHGNRFYRIRRPANINAPVEATLRWTVARSTLTSGNTTGSSETELARYLAPNALVPVGHEILQPILAEVRSSRKNDSPEATARAIYDWVVDNVEYKKVGAGWGNGDTFWACNERYGNCTDFHSLFISLARSEGIPARFEIGFPVPLDRSEGEISGYHCWVQFYLPGRGWVPIDASEAAKHPQQRELLYGTHPADRILFSMGRDLVLSPGTDAMPLNYFIYPHVELGGKPWRVELQTAFSYREVAAG